MNPDDPTPDDPTPDEAAPDETLPDAALPDSAARDDASAKGWWDSTTAELEELRRRAEEQVEEEERERWSPTGPRLSIDEVRAVVHELRVHQIELEMQNEELRRAQAEMERSRERYFELYDLAPVAYLTLSESSTILEANLTAVRLLGEERSTLLRRPFTRFIRRESQDVYYRHRRKLFETGTPRACELEMDPVGDGSFTARIESTLARGHDGQPVHRMVVSDITRRKREEEARLVLEQRVQQAEKAESLGRMAGAIAHHFNNLLGVTTGNLELRLKDLSTADAADEGLNDALSAARSAAEVSRMLLTYLGQEQGRHRSRDLSEACRLSMSVLRSSLPSGVRLEVDLPTPGPAVEVSDAAIPEVLRNLVTNAWEACDARPAEIRIEVREVEAGDIPERNRFPKGWSPKAERYAVLAVTDEGSGIDVEEVDSLFDPFFSSKAFGRGLGLSVTLGTVKAHEGAIVVRSTRGRGTTVEVCLPVSDLEVLEPVAAGGTTGQAMEGTILVVDDEPMVRSLAVRMLEILGFDTLTAEDGVAALEVWGRHADEIVCVVCDLTMPRMNGWETLAALRERRPGLPVVLMSGYDRGHAMSGDHAERPQTFLSKPWDLARLEAAVEAAMTE